MTKLTEYMTKYVKTYYDNSNVLTRLIWRIKLKFMTDTQIIEEYYRITRRVK